MTTTLPVINQSQLKAWRQCERAWAYKYADHLVPKRKNRPMHLGTWGHACLEAHYRDGDWRLGHAPFVKQYEELFDEERTMLDKGDEPLPSQIERIMESYLWYYRDEDWKFIAVEQSYEVVVLTGDEPFILKIRIDGLMEDPDGLRWVVDHKWPANIPDRGAFHAMDPQLILYPWVLAQNGIETEGVIFNYVRAKAPTIPSVNKDGSISKRPISTDHPTVHGFLVAHGLDPDDYTDLLAPLSAGSEFLARYRMPRSATVTERVLHETGLTATDIIRSTDTTRNVTRDCARCGYLALCRADLFGLDTSVMRRASYTIEQAVVEEVDLGISSDGE